MSATSIMALQGATAASQAMGQSQQAGAVLASGEYNYRLRDWNARLAERDAKREIEKGNLQEQRFRSDVSRLRGEQRAALAAQGIDIGSGVAADLLDETRAMGELDALTIRNNAARQSLGFKVEADEQRAAGRMEKSQTRQQAKALKAGSYNTLLTGGAQVYATRHFARKNK